MSHIIKSFAELSWPVVVLDAIDNPDVSLQLLPSISPTTLPGTDTLLVAAVQSSLDPLAQVGAWHHGGINE